MSKKRKKLYERKRGDFQFITGDKYESGKIFEADVASGKTIELDEAKLKELAEQGLKRYEEFYSMAKSRMNRSRALHVKELRMKEQYSWRAIAARCWAEWKGDWWPATNQLAGMAICEVASEILNEIVD